MREANLSIKLQYDDETDHFIMSYLDGEKFLFQVKMSPDDFEKMTNDMIRTVKNYNLAKAQGFLNKPKPIENQSEAIDGEKVNMVDGEAQGQGIDGSPVESPDSQPASA